MNVIEIKPQGCYQDNTSATLKPKTRTIRNIYPPANAFALSYGKWPNKPWPYQRHHMVSVTKMQSYQTGILERRCNPSGSQLQHGHSTGI
jgi:hypothetical protein